MYVVHSTQDVYPNHLGLSWDMSKYTSSVCIYTSLKSKGGSQKHEVQTNTYS